MRRAAREWWPNLPMLLVGSIVVAAGWAVLRSVAGSGWISLVGLGLLLIPLLAVLLDGAAACSTTRVGVLQLVRGLPGVVGRAWRVTGPVTVVAGWPTRRGRRRGPVGRAPAGLDDDLARACAWRSGRSGRVAVGVVGAPVRTRGPGTARLRRGWSAGST